MGSICGVAGLKLSPLQVELFFGYPLAIRMRDCYRAWAVRTKQAWVGWVAAHAALKHAKMEPTRVPNVDAGHLPHCPMHEADSKQQTEPRDPEMDAP
jgi:hypothetical protein